jgi:glycine/D-amino acid oxidase-like deaminating enzyme
VSEIFDLGVIGGGVNGAACALFAARGGMRVALLERGQLCREASGVNAGTLTLQMTRAALIPYALRAHAMWADAPRWLGHDVGVVVCDGLSVAFTEGEAALLEERAAKRRAAGAPITVVSGARAREIEPGLSEEALVAGHCAVDGYANAYLTGLAFRRALVEAGVVVQEDCQVTGLARDGETYVAETAQFQRHARAWPGHPRLHEQHGDTKSWMPGPSPGMTAEGSPLRFRRVVLAGGVWIEPMLGWLGVRLPIKTLVNQLAVTERIRPVMRTVLGIASGLLSLKQYGHGTVVIGGGWQGRGDRARGGVELVPERLVGNVRLACHAIPALKSARLARAWAGLEAETADAMPAVGPVPGAPDAYVLGSIHSGYTSGPYIAKLLADRLLGREPEMPLFPIDRLLAPVDAAA